VRGLYDNSTLCRKINHAMNPAETEALLLEYLDILESHPEPVLEATNGNGHSGEAETDGNGSGDSP
jgi:hypothetical protein